MALIKDIYSPTFYNRLADSMQQVLPAFDKTMFLEQIFDADFQQKEWKERMKHTTRVLHAVMPEDFSEAVKLIDKCIIQLKQDGFGDENLAFMFFPDYIESYGLAHFTISVSAFEFITQFISCEFSVRPFIIKYGEQMISEMVKWSLHPHPKVRRLASEGSRPRLPWAMAIPALKKDPTPILPILENLKNDPAEFVRRSVANNLNDIAKDNPDIVLEIAQKWQGISAHTDAVIKHGCRTLLKQGHATILQHYGLVSKDIELSDFAILTPEVKIGDRLDFSFTLYNNSTVPKNIRLEYALYYMKSKGHLARKVFKISERMYAPNEYMKIFRSQSFKLITTRVFHTGEHQLAIIMNGKESEPRRFVLTE